MPLTPTQKGKMRSSISSYCKAAVANEPRIHYSQARPFPLIDLIGSGHHTLDCSGFVCNCYWNAMHDLKIYVRDPLNERYSGWGNTGTMETFLRRYGKRVTEVNGYLVGDIGRWGTGAASHTAICSKAGTAETAQWTSHGREAGPIVVELNNYRDDLVGVWRHPSFL